MKNLTLIVFAFLVACSGSGNVTSVTDDVNTRPDAVGSDVGDGNEDTASSSDLTSDQTQSDAIVDALSDMTLDEDLSVSGCGVWNELKAFPTAEGFGATTVGGRGGRVIKVVNLDDAGPGSLRDAVEQTGPRTVVFDVGGVITLQDNLIVTNPNLTIAGQSAPGDGVVVTGASFIVRTSDVVVRFLRLRLGDNGYKDANGNVVGVNAPDSDTLGIQGGNATTSGVMIDHCSISWSIDENIGMFGGPMGIDGVTIQNSIVSEALLNSHHDEGGHSMGALLNQNTQNVSFYRNVFAHNSERHVRSGGGCSFEMVNNLVYDFRYTSVISAANRFRVEANYYKEGATAVVSTYAVDYVSQDPFDPDDTEAFVLDNLAPTLTEIDPAFSPYLSNVRPIDSGIIAAPVDSVEASILPSVGASIPTRDAIDIRIVSDFENGTGSIIDTPAEVGGLPNYSAGVPAADSDNDGMPDVWETERGLDPSDNSDASTDRNGDGYSNLEEFLNCLVEDSAGL